MEFWQEFPPVFVLVNWFVGYKSNGASDGSGDGSRRSRRPRGKVEGSSKDEKIAFVAQWGGTAKHTDSLPSFVQAAFHEAMMADWLAQQEENKKQEQENGRRG